MCIVVRNALFHSIDIVYFFTNLNAGFLYLHGVVYPRFPKEITFSNYLTVETDHLTVTLCNIWPISFREDEALLIMVSGGKNLSPVTILRAPKCP